MLHLLAATAIFFAVQPQFSIVCWKHAPILFLQPNEKNFNYRNKAEKQQRRRGRQIVCFPHSQNKINVTFGILPCSVMLHGRRQHEPIIQKPAGTEQRFFGKVCTKTHRSRVLMTKANRSEKRIDHSMNIANHIII